VPSQVRMWALPIHTTAKLSHEAGIYAQDSWTVKRATINGGVRFDYYKNSFPTQTLGPGLFVPNRNITFQPTSFYGLKDLTPRIGIAYDLFGTGKTALKVNYGKYVEAATSDAIYSSNNPAARIITRIGSGPAAARGWTDGNGNYLVDCDLLNPLGQNNLATGGDQCDPDCGSQLAQYVFVAVLIVSAVGITGLLRDRYFPRET